ncbi:MAG TPA: glycoside hydrolase family 38 C-terminal domain-containing protein [Gemmatimonadales bacterium]|nr:glycoside hydrolase family 38 C-terminal domain-containing protein [Gemmatimonadales bacterium]
MPRTTYHLIPHTHWDREWYLTSAEFLPRLVSTIDDLVERLGRAPGFRAFLLDGQTVLVEDYLRVRPEHADALTELVRAGRLQVGPWYVLADELIPSGESLLRNLLAGAADAGRLGGRLDVLYSPDAFGHPSAWPSLAAEFGIPYGALWRGLGGEPGQQGDLYRWRDRAGREVRLYHLPPDGYEVGAALPSDPVKLRDAWAAIGPALRARSTTGHVAVFVGADHHAAHPDPDALRSALTKLEPDADVRISRLDEFLRAAWEDAPKSVPVLTGELRWSYGYTWTLQGVHGTRAPLKRRHAEAELRLERLAEPLAALDRWRRGHDRRPILDAAWRTLIRTQFHDSLGGCTSDPVARRVLARVEDAAAIGAELERAALHSLAGYDPDAARDAPGQVRPELLLWNPVPRARAGVVVADLGWFRRDVLVGPPGARRPRTAPAPSERELSAVLGGAPYQVLGRRRRHDRLDSARHYPDQDVVELVRVALAVPESPGFALTRPRGCDAPAAVRAVDGGIGNGRLAVGVDRGRIWLRDLAKALELPSLFSLESEPDAGDTYTFARGSGRTESSSRWEVPTVLAEGPLVGAIETRTRLLDGRVSVRLILSLQAGSDALRCTLELDNQARDHRLRLRCAAGGRVQGTTAGAAFGVARRKVAAPDGRYPKETPVATAPAQRFVAAHTQEAGVAVFAPGFFEYEAGETSLFVTLLRAVGQLSRDDLPTRPGHAGWPTPVPDAQCLGAERLQLGVTLASSDSTPSALARTWEDLFLPPRAVWIRQSLGLDPVRGGLELRADELVFSALKPSADGRSMILRCYNPGDRRADGVAVFDPPVRAAVRVTADEREVAPVTLAPDRRHVSLAVDPGEIVSLRVDPE